MDPSMKGAGPAPGLVPLFGVPKRPSSALNSAEPWEAVISAWFRAQDAPGRLGPPTASGRAQLDA